MSFPASKSNQKQLRKPRSNKNLKAFKPQMTSLIDLMTVIIIFLLQSFSTEGQIVTVSSDLSLPKSSAKKTPELNVNILVTTKYIMAENEKLISIEEVLNNDDLVVQPLYDWLGQRRELTEKIAQYTTKMTFKGNVTIQGDRRIHFRLLKKIMYTCGQQGFNNFALAVESTSE
jgi:biopolymer transport protein ExbD